MFKDATLAQKAQILMPLLDALYEGKLKPMNVSGSYTVGFNQNWMCIKKDPKRRADFCNPIGGNREWDDLRTFAHKEQLATWEYDASEIHSWALKFQEATRYSIAEHYESEIDPAYTDTTVRMLDEDEFNCDLEGMLGLRLPVALLNANTEWFDPDEHCRMPHAMVLLCGKDGSIDEELLEAQNAVKDEWRRMPKPDGQVMLILDLWARSLEGKNLTHWRRLTIDERMWGEDENKEEDAA